MYYHAQKYVTKTMARTVPYKIMHLRFIGLMSTCAHLLGYTFRYVPAVKHCADPPSSLFFKGTLNISVVRMNNQTHKPLQPDWLRIAEWSLRWHFCCRGLISDPRPVLGSSAQTTQGMLLDFL